MFAELERFLEDVERFLEARLLKCLGEPREHARCPKLAARERLGAWLLELGLERHVLPAMKWARESGMCDLGEVVEHLEGLVTQLQPTPMAGATREQLLGEATRGCRRARPAWQGGHPGAARRLAPRAGADELH